MVMLIKDCSNNRDSLVVVVNIKYQLFENTKMSESTSSVIKIK